ncbi:hypothetical protein FKO01_25525 [Mesorhizobium sp. B2-3-3]|nr:hypothetical protein FKO01_25525 [Mesorhizobium sp. B2-3-3]
MLENNASQNISPIIGYLREVYTPRIYLTILGVMLAAFTPEIAYTTFSHDYFFTLFLTSNLYALDGRYLAEIIRLLSFGYLPPNLLLVLGLLCMVGCGVVFCFLFRISHWIPVVITCSLFATFPMMFEIWSYPSTRFTVPLAALLAVAALAVPSLSVGAILICAALATYQSAVYLTVVAAFYVTAVRVAAGQDGFKAFAIPRAIMVVAGGCLYAIVYFVLSHFFHLGGERLAGFVHIVTDPGQFMSGANIILLALKELATRGMFLFPLIAKLAYLALAAIVLALLAMRRSLIGIALVCMAPLCIFGAAWVTFPPHQMLFDRILFSFVGVYAGTFLAAWTMADRRTRYAINSLGAFLIVIFTLQANIWHQYMDLRNRADMDMTQLIAARIRDLPDYRPGMPITIIGATQDSSYLPYRTFDTSRGIIRNTMFRSTYFYPWASARLLMFYFPLSDSPPPEMVQAATTGSGDMPIWPSPASVAVRSHMVIVRLN